MLVIYYKKSEFDVALSYYSADVSIQSRQANVIKSTIAYVINSAMHFLCIVEDKISKNSWFDWEIGKIKMKLLKKKLVEVKALSDNTTPRGLLTNGVSWVILFTFNDMSKPIAARSLESIRY